jgi:uncharacterized protein YkwD
MTAAASEIGVRARIAALAFASLCVAAADVEETAQAVVERTNAFRESQRLQPQTADPALAHAARDFARFMATTGKYGHTADGRKPAERAAAQGYEYCIVRENIAYLYRSTGYDTTALARALVEGWKKSPGHRKNMLDPAATQTGVGVAQGKDGRYYGVQVFGRPKSAAIRFSVENRSASKIDYHAGERRFSLPARSVRTHTVCRPLQLIIDVQPKPITARPRGGESYVVR